MKFLKVFLTLSHCSSNEFSQQKSRKLLVSLTTTKNTQNQNKIKSHEKPTHSTKRDIREKKSWHGWTQIRVFFFALTTSFSQKVLPQTFHLTRLKLRKLNLIYSFPIPTQLQKTKRYYFSEIVWHPREICFLQQLDNEKCSWMIY